MFWCSVKQKQSLRREMEDLDSCQTLNRQVVVRPSEPLLSAAIFIQSIGCICLTFLHCVFWNLVFIHYVFSNLCVFSNEPRKLLSVWDHLGAVFIQGTKRWRIQLPTKRSQIILSNTIGKYHPEIPLANIIVKYYWQIFLSNISYLYWTCQTKS